MVDRSEVVKGYEYQEGKYVLVEPHEIKKIEPESARSMEILSFVKAEEIDPLFFDASYFVVPEDEGRKAYQLDVGWAQNGAQPHGLHPTKRAQTLMRCCTCCWWS
jgi:hypothetical protein